MSARVTVDVSKAHRAANRAAPEYHVYGGRVRSEIPLPELSPAAEGDPTWTIRRRTDAAPPGPARVHGEQELDGGASHVTLGSDADGWLRLAFPDTGVYRVAPDGRDIDWHVVDDADPDLVRVDLLGRVLAIALEQRGAIALHGSAVAIDDGAIVCLAPKGAGKSTLSLALVAGGASHLADDMAVVQPGTPPVVLPGPGSARVWDDALAAITVPGAAPRRMANGKLALQRLEAASCRTTPTPLAAVYLLSPVPNEGGTPAARRSRLPVGLATVALLAQARLAPLLDRSAHAARLARAAAVVREVPVYRLEVMRDLARLAEGSALILDWLREDQRAGSGG